MLIHINGSASIAIGDSGIAAGRHSSLKAHDNESSARSMRYIKPRHPPLSLTFFSLSIPFSSFVLGFCQDFAAYYSTIISIFIKNINYTHEHIHFTKRLDMSNKFLSLAVLALGVLTQNSAAYFRMSCSQIQIGRIDPIVNPKSFSPHAHKISGPSSKYQSMPHPP